MAYRIMHPIQRLAAIKKTLGSIVQMLSLEEECNWIKSFKRSYGYVCAAIDAEVSDQEALFHMKDHISSIWKGNGSFSDFHIWRDDFDERCQINDEFSLLINHLRELLNFT